MMNRKGNLQLTVWLMVAVALTVAIRRIETVAVTTDSGPLSVILGLTVYGVFWGGNVLAVLGIILATRLCFACMRQPEQRSILLPAPILLGALVLYLNGSHFLDIVKARCDANRREFEERQMSHKTEPNEASQTIGASAPQHER